jgi:uncharacterized protein
MTLDPIQLRVLGALVEKEITTPENYPLSLNSLISACNQRSSRDPVLDLSEDEVRQAVHSLEDVEIVSPVRDSRVPKYEHRIRTVLNLRRDETAILCLLLLRGPQTPGELRGRADRMYSFEDIASVQSTLERMANRSSTEPDGTSATTGALVVQLARQPGSRESRYAHLLGGPIAAAPQQSTSYAYASTRSFASADTSADTSEDEHLSARIQALEAALTALEARVDAMEKAKLKASAEETSPA